MLTRRQACTAVLAAALLAAGCSGVTAPTDPKATGGLDAATIAKLDAAMATALAAAKAPGALVGVWSPEGEYVKAVGVADTATGAPMKTDFYSRIGSVTKTFTATALLQLVDDGAIGLDDPIAKYVDGVPGGESITLRQLATMRSGLADYLQAEDFDAAVAADPTRTFTPAEMLGWAFAEPAAFPPGRQYQYSNTNYILLGLVVEKAGGKPLPDYLTEHICGPLGLSHTSFPTGTQFPEPHARGYTEPVSGNGPPIDASGWTASFTWAAGAMISTLADMRIWVPAMATGRLISPGLQAQRPQSPPADGLPPGLGYGMGVFTANGWIGHNGSLPGYQTVAIYLPARQMTMVVLVNTDITAPGGPQPSTALANALTAVLTPDHLYTV